MFYFFQMKAALMASDCLDAGLWRIRALACQILRSEVGGDTPRKRAFLDTLQLSPGPLGRHKPRGVVESHSQPQADAIQS